MATKKKGAAPPPEPPQVTPGQGAQLLKQQVGRAKDLLDQPAVTSDAHSAWVLLTRNHLEKAFGTGSPNIASVVDVGRYGAFPMNAGEAWWEQHRRTSLTTQLSKLRALIEVLESDAALESPAKKIVHAAPAGHRIFLVHGHDERYLQEVARFLEKLQQTVTVLREEPSKGRTIIEKFEDYSDVGFAVILLTADDLGRAKRDAEDTLQPRARQNVILELGYFIGKLGRSRVCALHVSGVEIPSDYSGVAFVRLDEGGARRLELAKELKAAKFNVDMNNAL